MTSEELTRCGCEAYQTECDRLNAEVRAECEALREQAAQAATDFYDGLMAYARKTGQL